MQTSDPTSDLEPTPLAESSDTNLDAWSVRKRTRHACDRCRMMRTKCTGRPCTECSRNGAVCQFNDRKRERSKKYGIPTPFRPTTSKNFESLNERLAYLERQNQALLNALSKLANTEDIPSRRREDISKTLNRLTTTQFLDSIPPLETDLPMDGLQSGITSPIASTSLSGEQLTTSDVASPSGQGDLAKVVDLDLGRGLNGFLGKTSAISWIYRAWQLGSSIEGYGEQQSQQIPVGDLASEDWFLSDIETPSAETFSYFTDEEDLLSVDEDYVQPFELPDSGMAIVLSEAYFQFTSGSSYFVDRVQFLETLPNLLGRESSTFTFQDRVFLMKANIIWAFSARWLALVAPSYFKDLESHLVFYARARALGLDPRVPFDHPNLDMIESSGVLVSYLLMNGSVSRAWNTLGPLLRHCIALGVNLRIKLGMARVQEQRRRAELWFSLFGLETQLSELTGRPRLIDPDDITISLDLSALRQTEDRENLSSPAYWQNITNNIAAASSGAYSNSYLRESSFLAAPPSALDKISFTATSKLRDISNSIRKQYHGATSVTWHDFHVVTKKLHSELNEWRQVLPESLAFLPNGEGISGFSTRISLFLQWASLNMMLFRPYVCTIHVMNESKESRTFDQTSARTCIEAALSVLQVFTTSAILSRTIMTIQWWYTLNCTCQALGILLLEISLHHRHGDPDNLGRIMIGLRDAFKYIETLCHHNKSAFKLWNLSSLVLRTALQKYQAVGLLDIPTTAPQPQKWTIQDQTAFDVELKLLGASNI